MLFPAFCIQSLGLSGPVSAAGEAGQTLHPMKRFLFLLVMFAYPFELFAGTKADAQAFVKQAVGYYKEHGKEAALKAFSDRTGPFVKGELYLTVWDPTGVQIAHGFNPKLIGRNLIDLKDCDGKEFVKDFMKITESGWVDYKWTNPISKKIEPKSVYLERIEDVIIGAGVYTK